MTNPLATGLEVDAALKALREQRYRFTNEDELQRGAAMALTIAGIGHRREVRLSAADRIDFLLGNGVGIEVKVDGSISLLTRQLHRYSKCSEIQALVVLTSLTRLANLPKEMGGKPIHVHLVSRAFA